MLKYNLEVLEQECKNCDFFVEGDNFGFRVYHFEKGSRATTKGFSANYILFVLDGCVKISYEEITPAIFKPGFMGLIPYGGEVAMEVLENSKFVVMKFDAFVTTCRQLNEEDYSSYLKSNPEGLSLLEIKEPLQLFLELFLDLIDRGLDCIHLHDNKRKEFFFILRAYYSKEEIAQFLYPILSSEFQFKDFVFKNYKKVNNVNELIELSELSRAAFYSRFKKEFGITAKQWMQQKKSEAIRLRLSTPGASIKEVMYDFDFNSPSEFTRFCKAYLGDTPSSLVAKNE